MPNWCTNTLLISGPPEELRKFRKRHLRTGRSNRELDLNFNTVITYPEKYKEWDKIVQRIGWTLASRLGLKDGYSTGGYNWRITNWGTKWDAGECRTEYRPEAEYIEISFDTAWSPPIPIIERLIHRWRRLRFIFDYHEPGNAIIGHYEGEGGRVTEYRDWTMTHEDYERLGYNDNDGE